MSEFRRRLRRLEQRMNAQDAADPVNLFDHLTDAELDEIIWEDDPEMLIIARRAREGDPEAQRLVNERVSRDLEEDRAQDRKEDCS